MAGLREHLERTPSGVYPIERELGGSGMSRVFLAEEGALGRKVVVKVLPPELTGAVSIERFKREIQVAARLQHAHIVPVLTAGETDGLPYYTMPFVEGESLRRRLDRDGALPIADAVSVLRDVARALQYAHERGIVHRDIKPDNGMLAAGTAVVTDFGIAKALAAATGGQRLDRNGPQDSSIAALTTVGTALGTPAYMAPEQAAGDPATDHRADLYAFGSHGAATHQRPRPPAGAGPGEPQRHQSDRRRPDQRPRSGRGLHRDRSPRDRRFPQGARVVPANRRQRAGADRRDRQAVAAASRARWRIAQGGPRRTVARARDHVVTRGTREVHGGRPRRGARAESTARHGAAARSRRHRQHVRRGVAEARHDRELHGKPISESTDSAFRQAYRYRDRVPEVERRFIEGSYFSLGPGRDRAKAVAAYEEALRLGDTIRTAYNPGMRYVSRREFAKAESLFRAGQRVGAFDDRARGLAPARALAFEGKYAAADTVYAEALERFPNWRLPKLYRLDLLYLRGDTGAFRRAVDSVAARGDSVARDWASQKAIQLALLDGREREASRLYAAASASLGMPSAPERLARLIDPAAEEMRLRMRRDTAALARELDAAGAEAPLARGAEADRQYFAVALAYAHAGRSEKARAVLAKYDADVKDTAVRRSQLPERQNVLGEILLAENKPLDATVEFRKSDRLPDGPAHECTVCLPFNLARAFDRAGVTDSAIVYYEQFLTTPFPDRLITWMDPLFRPRFTKRLGELYESRGDVAKAAEWYRRFLALWSTQIPRFSRRSRTRATDCVGWWTWRAALVRNRTSDRNLTP